MLWGKVSSLFPEGGGKGFWRVSSSSSSWKFLVPVIKVTRFTHIALDADKIGCIFIFYICELVVCGDCRPRSSVHCCVSVLAARTLRRVQIERGRGNPRSAQYNSKLPPNLRWRNFLCVISSVLLERGAVVLGLSNLQQKWEKPLIAVHYSELSGIRLVGPIVVKQEIYGQTRSRFYKDRT